MPPQRNAQKESRFAAETDADPLADAVVPPFGARQLLPAHLHDVRDQDWPVRRPNQVRAVEIEVEVERGDHRSLLQATMPSSASLPVETIGRVVPRGER